MKRVEIEGVDLETLVRSIASSIKEEFKAELRNAIPKPVEYLTQQEACKLLKVSPHTFQKYVNDPKKPVNAYRISNTLRYRKDEVLALEKI